MAPKILHMPKYILKGGIIAALNTSNTLQGPDSIVAFVSLAYDLSITYTGSTITI